MRWVGALGKRRPGTLLPLLPLPDRPLRHLSGPGRDFPVAGILGEARPAAPTLPSGPDFLPPRHALPGWRRAWVH